MDNDPKVGVSMPLIDVAMPPPGFSVFETADKKTFLVPTYMVPATKLSLETTVHKALLQVKDGSIGPRPLTNPSFLGIGEGLVYTPVDPDYSDRERLELHAEVKALQDLLGISYKDAAHRLYMMELEKLKTGMELEGGHAHIRSSIDNTITNEILPAISKIDGGNLK